MATCKTGSLGSTFATLTWRYNFCIPFTDIFLAQTRPDMTAFTNSLHRQWATPHSIPRVAQGAWKAGLMGIWSELTNNANLETWTCGKPTAITYQYAEGMLKRWHKTVNPHAAPIHTVYMVGDNPQSDVRGAMLADADSQLLDWRSVQRAG